MDKLCPKVIKNHKGFLYAAYKQQYLEYIEHREIQKALTHLNKRLKPLEMLAPTSAEFRDVCYLLTAKAVHDAPSFKNWEGIQASREKLVEQFQSMFDFEAVEAQGQSYVPPNRLLHLLRQAVAYQVEFSRYHPKIAPKITSLLEDYKATVIPNAEKHVFRGHTANVKCVEFVGEDGELIASGSSDNTCKLWNTITGECVRTLSGHLSRVWDISSNKAGTIIASASGDKTVKLWNVHSASADACISTFSGHEGDVYSVRFHPAGKHVASAGYDQLVRLFDVERETVVKTFSGHSLSISSCIFSPVGNLVITGSKDCTIRFWDLVSGLCIKTITSHLGEVTSIEMNSNGLMLLSGSKDNSNRLWDVRMVSFRDCCDWSNRGVAPTDSTVQGSSEYVQELYSKRICKRFARCRWFRGTSTCFVYPCNTNLDYRTEWCISGIQRKEMFSKDYEVMLDQPMAPTTTQPKVSLSRPAKITQFDPGGLMKSKSLNADLSFVNYILHLIIDCKGGLTRE